MKLSTRVREDSPSIGTLAQLRHRRVCSLHKVAGGKGTPVRKDILEVPRIDAHCVGYPFKTRPFSVGFSSSNQSEHIRKHRNRTRS